MIICPASSTGYNCLIPVPKRLPIPAAMISNVVFIVISHFFYQIDSTIVFILHISANHRSLPAAHLVAVCEYQSSYRVEIHTVLFCQAQAIIRQYSAFGSDFVHFA